MAVVGGLCHSSISRLKDTTSHVPSEVTKVNDTDVPDPADLAIWHSQQSLKNIFLTPQVLNEMTDLLSSCRNYDNYRQAYNRCTGFKIPILGVHLKDLISVNEAMSDYVEVDKVNVQKLQALYSHINDLIQLQQVPPRLDANKDLVHLLTVVHSLIFAFQQFIVSFICMWFTRSYWRQAQMQMSVIQHVDCPRSCGCDESLWSMSVWVTNWVWMGVSSDCCIVTLTLCGAFIILEQ